MNEVLERRFAEMGARVSLGERPWRGRPRIDVRADAQGEVFTIDFNGRGTEIEVEVVDVQPRDRHLLLLVRDGGEKSKFLCGHDERHWFVAAVPETARGVTGVTTAKLALQPEAVHDRLTGVRPKDRLRRRNAAFVRQGEWFFVPTVLWPEPLAAHVLRDEPLTRGRGKAHMLQFAFRRGGNVVWVNRSHPTGIGEAAYRRAQRRGANARPLHADGPRPRGVREGRGPPSGPRDDPPGELAPRVHEHRAARAGHAARRVPRLTHPVGAVAAAPTTIRDRPTAGRRALNAEIEVRILVPELVTSG